MYVVESHPSKNNTTRCSFRKVIVNLKNIGLDVHKVYKVSGVEHVVLNSERGERNKERLETSKTWFQKKVHTIS